MSRLHPSLWFLVPVHGRLNLTRLCLERLRATCDDLVAGGIEASAVVLGDDESMDVARDLGFGTVTCDNDPLGRKWNHGFQLACDPDFNPRPVDYVVPFGSDDWVDSELLLTAPLPVGREITCFTRGAVVSETGQKLARLKIGYAGGFGIRIIPRSLVERARYRPSEEHKRRALDTAILKGITTGGHAPKLVYHDLHDLQIVDWKTRGAQLNTYQQCLAYRRDAEALDPWRLLEGVYPHHALTAMRNLYSRALVPA